MSLARLACPSGCLCWGRDFVTKGACPSSPDEAGTSVTRVGHLCIHDQAGMSLCVSVTRQARPWPGWDIPLSVPGWHVCHHGVMSMESLARASVYP